MKDVRIITNPAPELQRMPFFSLTVVNVPLKVTYFERRWAEPPEREKYANNAALVFGSNRPRDQLASSINVKEPRSSRY